MCPEAIRRELANRLSQLLSRSGNGQDRDGNAIVDVSLNVLAALLVTAVNNQVIDDLVGDDLEGPLPVARPPQRGPDRSFGQG